MQVQWEVQHLNMINELKILFENIKNFRHLITEGVGEKDIVNAIQNHEYLYIYYEGDDGNNYGYRTIRPYVLGTHKKSGNAVLRAWQDNPKNSHDFENRATRKDSENHDYWVDGEGIKPGWRMFRLDKITKVYPIGKKFNDSNGLVMIPAGYHEGGDDDMSDVVAYVSTKTQPDFDYKYDKAFSGDTMSKSAMMTQKWDSIRRGNKNKKKITADDVIKLSDIASRVMKKNKNSFFVAIDDKNNFQLVLVSDKDKKSIPDGAIVGGLANLYDTLVKSKAPAEDAFFKSTKTKTQRDLELNKQKEMDKGFSTIQEIDINLPKIPYIRKPFFKQ